MEDKKIIDLDPVAFVKRTDFVPLETSSGTKLASVGQLLDAVGVRSAAHGSAGFALKAASITASSTVLTLSAAVQGRSSFTPADVGKKIQVVGAGTNGADLYTTIADYTDTSTVTLADAATTTVSGKEAFWYPADADDTAAIQAAIDGTTAEDGAVYLPDAVYVISAPLVGTSNLRRFYGNGIDKTYIVVSSAAFRGDMLSVQATARATRIENLTLKHRGAPTTTTAAITKVSITSNVATFIANNTFSAGDRVILSALTAESHFNDTVGTVLSSGLSATQFSIAYTRANVALTNVDGFASLDENCLALERANAIVLYADITNVQAMRAPGAGFSGASTVVCRYRGCVACQNNGHGFQDTNYLSIGNTATSWETCWADRNYLAGYYLSNCYYSRLDSCASDRNGTNFYIANCYGVSLVACGSEATQYRSAALAGWHFNVRSGGGVTLDSCYAQSKNGSGNAASTHFRIANSAVACAIRNCVSVGATVPPTNAFEIIGGTGNACTGHYFLDMPNTAWSATGTGTIVVIDGTYKTPVTLTSPKILGSTGAAVAILALNVDWVTTNVFTKTLGAGANAITFSNAADGQCIIVILTGAGGGSTVTWPAGIKWPGGTPPVQTPSGTDVYTFVKAGSTIYGSVAQAMA